LKITTAKYLSSIPGCSCAHTSVVYHLYKSHHIWNIRSVRYSISLRDSTPLKV